VKFMHALITIIPATAPKSTYQTLTE